MERHCKSIVHKALAIIVTLALGGCCTVKQTLDGNTSDCVPPAFLIFLPL